VSLCIQEVSVLASDCAAMLVDIAPVPDGPYRLLSQLVAECVFPANLTALGMLLSRLDNDFEVTSYRLTLLVSCLLKVSASSVVTRGSKEESIPPSPKFLAVRKLNIFSCRLIFVQKFKIRGERAAIVGKFRAKLKL